MLYFTHHQQQQHYQNLFTHSPSYFHLVVFSDETNSLETVLILPAHCESINFFSSSFLYFFRTFLAPDRQGTQVFCQ